MIKQEDFIEVAKTLKDGYTWMKHFSSNNIPYDDIYRIKPTELAEILYKEELSNQHEEVENYINQIKILHAMYKRMSSLLIEVQPILFYNMLMAIDEFGGNIEDIIEGSIPRYIQELDIDYNNPKEWVEFVCRDNFNLEDLETGKIKFISVKDVKN